MSRTTSRARRIKTYLITILLIFTFTFPAFSQDKQVYRKRRIGVVNNTIAADWKIPAQQFIKYLSTKHGNNVIVHPKVINNINSEEIYKIGKQLNLDIVITIQIKEKQHIWNVTGYKNQLYFKYLLQATVYDIRNRNKIIKSYPIIKANTSNIQQIYKNKFKNEDMLVSKVLVKTIKKPIKKVDNSWKIKHSISLTTNASLPLGDLQKISDFGLNGSLSYNLLILPPYLSIGLQVDYHYLFNKKDDLDHFNTIAPIFLVGFSLPIYDFTLSFFIGGGAAFNLLETNRVYKYRYYIDPLFAAIFEATYKISDLTHIGLNLKYNIMFEASTTGHVLSPGFAIRFIF